MLKQELATRLQQLQADTYPGQSVRDAALESGVSYRTLGALLNGTGGKPTFATLTKLAHYYDVTVDYIVNGAAEPIAPTAAAIDEIRGLLHELEFKLNELEQRSLHTPPPPGLGDANVLEMTKRPTTR
jgi:transcriptional regulator with XRE-family HTH domain